MGSLFLSVIVLIFFISRYDKCDTRKEPKGNITLDEIQEMFENEKNNEDR